MSCEVFLPRRQEIRFPTVASNPANARPLRAMIANLPDGYRHARVSVELSFNVQAAPLNGSVLVIPIWHSENLGQGRDFRRSSAVQTAGAGDVAASFGAGEPAFASCVLDGFDAIEVSNTLDVDLFNVHVTLKLIAQPTMETGR